MRLSLKELPEFAKLEAQKQITKRPLANLLANSKRNVLLVIGLRMVENGGSSIYQALAISYVVAIMGLKGPIGALALVSASVLGLSRFRCSNDSAISSGAFPCIAVPRCFSF